VNRRSFMIVMGMCLFGVAVLRAAEPVSTNAPTSTAVLTNAVLQKVEYPRSYFVIEPTFGRDPFHPASTRRTKVTKPVEPVVPAVGVPGPEVPGPEGPGMTNALASGQVQAAPPDNDVAFLSVKGIIATIVSRVVTLNTTVRSYIFRTGDSMTVRVPDGRLRVRCLEIRGRSAVFQVENKPEPLELHLREE
jgi:hypothetical protein